MADGSSELVKMQDQFSGLDMGALIGAPLKAAGEAQIMLASATSEFIQSVGFEETEEGKPGKVRTVAFSFTRPRTGEKEGEIGSETVSMNVPLLSVIKIPNLAINDVDILFDMEVKSSSMNKETSDKSGTLEANAKMGWGFFSASVSVKGSIAAHQEHTRSSDNSAKYHVAVHATDTGMPEGLARVLDILATASAPTEIAEGKTA